MVSNIKPIKITTIINNHNKITLPIINEFQGTIYDSDIWDFEKLSIKNNHVHSMYKLNFTKLQPKWFLLITKKFIKFALNTKQFSSARSYLSAISHLSRFINKHMPECLPENINRLFALKFLNYIACLDISINTKHLAVTNVRTFIETVAKEAWLPFPQERIIFEEDIPKRLTTPPRFIPESVMKQLMTHIHSVREDQARAILVLIETGRRISELCILPINCLKYDDSNYPFLEVNDQKTKKIYVIPISKKCEAIIKLQQSWLKQNSLEKYGYLFLGSATSRSPCLKTKNLSLIIKKLAIENNIIGPDGKMWNFQTHQFRHTVGTRMINAGVSSAIIQRYLGHESPEMTSRYTHIHDQTLKEVFMKFQDNIDQISKEVRNYSANELEWLKGNIVKQCLSNGCCNLPLSQTRCPHANACLTCANFKTDQTYLQQHE